MHIPCIYRALCTEPHLNYHLLDIWATVLSALILIHISTISRLENKILCTKMASLCTKNDQKFSQFPLKSLPVCCVSMQIDWFFNCYDFFKFYATFFDFLNHWDDEIIVYQYLVHTKKVALEKIHKLYLFYSLKSYTYHNKLKK